MIFAEVFHPMQAGGLSGEASLDIRPLMTDIFLLKVTSSYTFADASK